MSQEQPIAADEASRSMQVRARLAQADRHVMLARQRMDARLSTGQPRNIAAYRGLDDGHRVTLYGRVLAKPPAAIPEDDHDWFDNLVSTYRRFSSRPLPGVPLELRLGSAAVTARTDADGYYSVELDSMPGAPAGWDQATAALADGGLSVPQPVLRIDPAARLGIISDIDDTILHSGITDWKTVAQLTFLHNARTRKPLPGVAALYTALQEGVGRQARNPVFYVSSSPWNLYDLLEDFIELNELPAGPVFLRDVRRFFGPGGHGHKLERTRELIQRLPALRWVLLGDSGQEDAELYAEAAREFGDRIAAVYIRDVDPDLESDRDNGVDSHIEAIAGTRVPMLRVCDSTSVARHAVSLGLLDAEGLARVEADVAVDRQRPSLGEAAVDEALHAASGP